MGKKCKGKLKWLCLVKDWFKQRRVWAALLSAVALFGFNLGYGWLPELCTFVAGVLALHSYAKPK